MKAGMVAAYRDKSGRDEAEIEALMRDKSWLSAQEAVALGLADRVEKPVRMAAHFDLSRFRNTPPRLAALVATTTPQEDDMPDFEIQTPQPERDAEPARPDAAAPEPEPKPSEPSRTGTEPGSRQPPR